jgi:hypothetical protein
MTQTPKSFCRTCGIKLDAATFATGPEDRKPKQGDVSICWYCSTISVYDTDMSLRTPTSDEMQRFMSDGNFLKLLEGIRAELAKRARKTGEVQ